MTEAGIRDYLAEHLNLLSADLFLIGKEFHLKNSKGSDGFVDILAKDSYNNYVIIEIKKSNQAARQALHEVVKYVALLKENFKIKDSEVRIFIVSVEWHELFAPFSEFCTKISIPIEGYRLVILDNCICNVEIIKPNNNSFSRKMSRQQLAFLYSTEQSLNSKAEIVFDTIIKGGIPDFLVFQMSTKKEIPFPYGLVVVFQQYEESFYCDLVNKWYYNIVEDISEYKEENSYIEYMHYLEESVISELINDIPRDTLEISYPEKFYSVINQQGWKINKVHKFGLFQQDARTNDDWLINEATGITGENPIIFNDICETKFRKKWEQIRENLELFLQFNSELKLLTEKIFSDISSLKENIRVRFWYYNPDDIIWSLFHCIGNNTIDGLPMFNVDLDCTESNIHYSYHAYLIYYGESVDYNFIQKYYFSNDDFSYFIIKQCGEIAQINSNIMDAIGLHFCMVKIKKDGENFTEENIALDDDSKYSFGYFMSTQKQLVVRFYELYKKYSNL